MEEDTGKTLEAIAQGIRDRNRTQSVVPFIRKQTPEAQETLGALPAPEDAGIWRVRVEVCAPDLFPVLC